MATPKVLTITLKFAMSDRKIHYNRIKAASDAAVEAGSQAVRSELLEGSVDHVTLQRHARITGLNSARPSR